ncbi:SDR family oxidoreductase [Paractinoplanes globisporus]|uniref:SDR family oxidoreductase n=1 Tax=Paractinoplanes globisporus TaxID=113565 RepID=A0ABW6W6A9_9ACTN|nr:SDR family oxidoreductase [Actinoplanes globisporus]
MSKLDGQTVVVIGGSAGMGLETARLARAEGADVVITGRNPDRLKQAAAEVGAVGSAAFDAADPVRLREFFDGLSGGMDHVFVTAGGPYYGLLADLDLDEAARHVGSALTLPLHLGRAAIGTVRGSLTFIGGTGARRPGPGLIVTSAMTNAQPSLIAGLAIEIAPIRVNLIAAGFVDTPLSARLLGDDLEKRRRQLRDTLPIGRVVGPEDVAALAVHLMTNTALTGATYDIDGGQQFVPRG